LLSNPPGNNEDMKNRNLAADLVVGAIAGAVGVWVMDRVTWDMYLNEDPKAFAK
jgi:hypothetical protein